MKLRLITLLLTTLLSSYALAEMTEASMGVSEAAAEVGSVSAEFCRKHEIRSAARRLLMASDAKKKLRAMHPSALREPTTKPQYSWQTKTAVAEGEHPARG